jgi:hypothetical protein
VQIVPHGGLTMVKHVGHLPCLTNTFTELWDVGRGTMETAPRVWMQKYWGLTSHNVRAQPMAFPGSHKAITRSMDVRK